jgi:hypothetical protein
MFLNLGVFLAFWGLGVSSLLARAFSEPLWKLGCKWEKSFVSFY